MELADTLCDRVAFIVDGRITLIDPPRALKLRYGAANVQVEYGGSATPAQQIFPLAGLGDNAAFLDLLHSGTVQTIHTQEATLEDIFVQVTGRRLV
jgi:fluoroquinolone transport system ATP-binding protein